MRMFHLNHGILCGAIKLIEVAAPTATATWCFHLARCQWIDCDYKFHRTITFHCQCQSEC